MIAAFMTFFQYVVITLVVVFLGPPMFLAELITRRTIRWKTSFHLFFWCLACWVVVGWLVVWAL